MGGVVVSVGLALLALATTCVLVVLALAAAVPRVLPELAPLTPLAVPAHYPGRRLGLDARILFVSRSAGTIALDCVLAGHHDGNHDSDAPPPGLPFTLQLRAPFADWFSARVEDLLRLWAEEDRELVIELRDDGRGRVRTTIAGDESSVHLELAGAPGLAPSQS